MHKLFFVISGITSILLGITLVFEIVERNTIKPDRFHKTIGTLLSVSSFLIGYLAFLKILL